MKTPPLITDDFVLQTPEARTLYHDYAEHQPIIDYHCHLSPKEVAEDIRWENIAQPWLGGDHYKWRAMRSNGIEEHFCTGNASDWEKFEKFAEAMPYMLRNPMYHWSHLELARYFDINDLLLSKDTAKEVWARTAAKLAEPDFSARGLMKKSNVKVVCTTDDPCDSLEYHAAIAADKSFDVKVLPAWRPDKGLQIENTEAWNTWVDKLGAAAGMDIATLDEFINALQKRHDFFDFMGCKLSDYGLSTVYAEKYTVSEIKAIFAKARGKQACDEKEVLQFKSFMLHTCGKMDAKSDWTWQIHYNALRNNNTKMFRLLGPDTGFDSIGDWPIAEGLSKLLDGLELEDSLPRTIVYTLNPRDNELLGAMIGNFQSAPTPSKMQFGSGWWFNDQMDGMTRHIEALSQLGMLSRFVGMLTDSRSFLSYTRHEYFRRILCNILGNDMAKGLIPHDYELVGRMVADISYNNANSYFKF
mgnify:FL=1